MHQRTPPSHLILFGAHNFHHLAKSVTHRSLGYSVFLYYRSRKKNTKTFNHFQFQVALLLLLTGSAFFSVFLRMNRSLSTFFLLGVVTLLRLAGLLSTHSSLMGVLVARAGEVLGLQGETFRRGMRTGGELCLDSDKTESLIQTFELIENNPKVQRWEFMIGKKKKVVSVNFLVPFFFIGSQAFVLLTSVLSCFLSLFSLDRWYLFLIVSFVSFFFLFSFFHKFPPQQNKKKQYTYIATESKTLVKFQLQFNYPLQGVQKLLFDTK